MRPSTASTPQGAIQRKEEAVPYAFVQDVASTWEQYERVTAPTVEPLPEGLILHVAGPTDEGFRIIDVWESEEAWERFQAERVAPAVAALGGPARPEPTFRGLHAAHVVAGAGGPVPTDPRKENR